MRKHISPTTVIASVALFFSLASAGMAATGYRITSMWQIAPSVRHALRGERGPQGIPGPQGVPGPAGPAGATTVATDQPRSASSYYTVYASSSLSTSSPLANVTARCKARGTLIQGGVTGFGDVVSESVPWGLDGWSAQAHLDPNASLPGQVVAWAVCVG